jgi:hypothetical protein
MLQSAAAVIVMKVDDDFERAKSEVLKYLLSKT